MTTLNGALPELRAAYDQLDAYARTQGIGIEVADFGGVRTLADTTRILAYRDDDFRAAVNAGAIRPDTTLQAFRPIAPFGSSYHNYGAAFDVRIKSRPSSMTVGQAQAKLGAYAPRIGLRWGGTFRNPDAPHFELAIPIDEAQRRYRAVSGSIVPTSAFDLSSLLPGLTPTSDDIEATLTVPDVYVAGDDSGVAALDIEEGPPPSLVMLGLVVAGVVAWALRRKFF